MRIKTGRGIHDHVLQRVPNMTFEDLQDTKFTTFVPIEDIQFTNKLFLRTIGYARSIDPTTDYLTLEYKGHTVLVNVKYIHPYEFIEGSLIQIIGDLERKRKRDSTELILKAQLYRIVNGLDVELYHDMQSLRKQSGLDCTSNNNKNENWNYNTT